MAGPSLYLDEDVRVLLAEVLRSRGYQASGKNHFGIIVSEQIPLSNLILSGKLKEHKEWRVVCSNDEISLVPQK